jgi:multidrug resistance protein, MATE family
MIGTEITLGNWEKGRIKRQFSELVRLSWPIILQRLGIMTLGIVDTAMVARFSSQELAYQTISYVPVATLIITSLGLMMGTMILTSDAYGAEDYEKCGRIWRRSLPYGFCIGMIGFTLCMFGEPILILLDQTDDIARGGAEVMFAIALGIPMTCVLLASTFFLEGINRPLPGMIFMLIANILNVFCNWVLVYGHLGFDPMGAVGSAWATSLIRTFLAIILIIYIVCAVDRKKYGLFKKVDMRWDVWRKHRHIGYASGLTNAIEHLGFASLSVFAGWLGVISLGALGIAFNVFGIPFMICYGVAGATSVRVGIARGRRDYQDMALAGICGLVLNTLIVIPMMVVLFAFPYEIADLFSEDKILVASTAPLIALSVWMLFFDTGQTVMGNALRGAQDIWMPAVFYILTYSLIMIPLAYYLTFILDHKTIGLIECIIYASVLSFILLSTRFFYLTLIKKAPL